MTSAAPVDSTPSVPIEKELNTPGIKITINSKTYEDTVDVVAADADFSVVDKYLKMKSEAYAHNEHDAFKLAKKQLNKVNHDKVAKVRSQLCFIAIVIFVLLLVISYHCLSWPMKPITSIC